MVFIGSVKILQHKEVFVFVILRHLKMTKQRYSFE